MSLERAAGMNGLSPMRPMESLSQTSKGSSALNDGVDFRRTLDQITSDAAGRAVPPLGGHPAAASDNLKFSNHAIERMRSRGISFSPDEMKSIESAVDKAAQKGSKDTLVLSGDNALIVSVKNNTVVTVMDRTAMKENVFTNIDSTVVI